MHHHRLGALALSSSLLVLLGCADRSETHLTAPLSPAAPLLSTTYGATLLECPVSETRTASTTIGALGGTLQLDGHRVAVPKGAVLAPTTFTITVPASNYVDVELRAGSGGSATFRQPVSVTLSYDRCTRSNIRKEDLRIYHVDQATKAILADMGGVKDPQARTVTTSTSHFSGYAIGVNRSGDEDDGTGGG
jgi:hypothetical protein